MASTEVQTLIDSVKSKSTKLKWAIGLGAALVLAPVTWAIGYAVLGATFAGAALALAGAVGLTVVNLTPVFLMKLENRKIQMIIDEANRNPIPTLWNEHKKDAEDLAEMLSAIEDYATEIGNVESKMKRLTTDLTPDDLASFESDINAMKTDLALQEQDYAEAMDNHNKQEVQIKRASAIWDLNMAVSAANAKNVNRAEETLAKIKRETALDAVTSSMNRSKAQLRARILNRAGTGQLTGVDRRPALSNSPSDVIDVQVSDASKLKVVK